ncbi:hypothetical protein LCGC14_0741170 [marine sediment metagenome]|uniref:Uncharacterized protein n=1 Tax=marine sediment metagenome TaxID=412755 RepID=A0A0F9QRQ7_9ZZZZ
MVETDQRWGISVQYSVNRAYALVGMLKWWLHEIPTEEFKDFTSMEQLWLAFVKKAKHGKHWNGEGWVNE